MGKWSKTWLKLPERKSRNNSSFVLACVCVWWEVGRVWWWVRVGLTDFLRRCHFWMSYSDCKKCQAPTNFWSYIGEKLLEAKRSCILLQSQRHGRRFAKGHRHSVNAVWESNMPPSPYHITLSLLASSLAHKCTKSTSTSAFALTVLPPPVLRSQIHLPGLLSLLVFDQMSPP